MLNTSNIYIAKYLSLKNTPCIKVSHIINNYIFALYYS